MQSTIIKNTPLDKLEYDFQMHLLKNWERFEVQSVEYELPVNIVMSRGISLIMNVLEIQTTENDELYAYLEMKINEKLAGRCVNDINIFQSIRELEKITDNIPFKIKYQFKVIKIKKILSKIIESIEKSIIKSALGCN